MHFFYAMCISFTFVYFPLMYYATKIQFSNIQQAVELSDCGLPAAHKRFSSLELISTAFIPEISLGRAEAE